MAAADERDGCREHGETAMHTAMHTDTMHTDTRGRP